MGSSAKTIVEEYQDSVLPMNHRELLLDLNLKNAAYVHGAAYGNNVIIEAGKIVVVKGLYSKNDININLKSKDAQFTVHSNIYAERSILCEANDKGVFRVCGTLVGQDIRLNRSIIYGTVKGHNVVLKNSIVFGNVFSNGTLKIENSFVSSFMAEKAELGNRVFLIEPYAIARKELSIMEPVAVYSLMMNSEIQDKYTLTEKDINELSGFDPDNPEAVYKVLTASNRFMNPKIINKKLEYMEKNYEELFSAVDDKNMDKVTQLESVFWEWIEK